MKMARWVKVEKETGKLINAIAGFEQGEENYDLCLQFALSNFKYHRFLAVDSHKVSRALKGIHEKLRIHSNHVEAEKFNSLTDSFLTSPVFEGKTEGKTDTHYALLSLLLTLADAPTRSTYEEGQKEEVQEEVEVFDWGAYLMEGLEPDGPYPESPVWSEDEEEEEDRQPHVGQREAVVALDDSGITVEEDPSRSTLAIVDTGQSWLTRNVVVQYWRGGSDHSVHSFQYSASLSREMEIHLRSSNLFYNDRGSTLVTETQAIRETLWLLSGVPESYIFTLDRDGKFAVRDGLKFSHLTQESLLTFLRRTATYGNIVYQLQQFVEAVLMNSYHDNSAAAVSQTHQAYATTTATYLQNLKKQMTILEKQAMAQEETMTLLTLTHDLRPRFHELEVLHRVHQEGIVNCRGSHSEQASHLLSTLYDTICEYDSTGEDGVLTVSLLLPLWIQTAKPYIDIIDGWITHGNLTDPVKEFIIQRNDNVKALDEKFWETAFSLHCSPTVEGSSSSEDITPGFTSNQEGTTQSDEQTYRKSSWAPTFLRPVLNHVIFAGKSMEMFQNLGRLLDVVEGSHPKPLYDTFVENLRDFLVHQDVPSKPMEQSPQNHNTLYITAHVSQQMLVKGTNDPLLRVNFAGIFRLTAGDVVETDMEQYNFSDMLEGETLQPIQVVLRHCLYPHITQKYNRVCTKLLDTLKTDYKMLHYMETMRKFFLMEAGDTMYDFYREIFVKLQLKEQWQDMSFLNVALHDTLQAHFPQEADKLFVSVQSTGEKGRDRHPIQALEGLTLHYKVPWPVDVVINTKCQEIYNKIFQFLLQIKRAKFCLDRLKFDDLEKSDPLAESNEEEERAEKTMPYNLIHRVQIFRLRLMHFVNSLHQYIMTRILHSTGLEFQNEVELATDLDQVIYIHNNYVSKIHERCLLHKRVAMIKETVTRVLNIAVGFQEKWNAGIDNISEKYLKHVEDEFKNCVKFLTSFLNNVIKRGSFPHLESLAFSLSTSLEQQQTR
ncbi:gamma-tubulin complex component 5 isoform X2 [Lingula anatina]|uniref:Gamma-tubulin complex component n=1 Tax=Lingula anatina TaxID=7574 RepID=A0A1S3JWH0_LINAN|nr:gamma-tubulin complex component 5 isoform X2 [Lingula anatina]|eukprot:XP_013414718.1 gamma-tubulin complex component 5 isoform X2 [Lingula anatina]